MISDLELQGHREALESFKSKLAAARTEDDISCPLTSHLVQRGAKYWATAIRVTSYRLEQEKA